jgi:NADPH:quinone reductase-like Zn-dependent oxidoreductase
MRATSLNYRDLITVQTGASGNSGLVPNSCGAGTVVQVGSEVSRVGVGDRVTPLFFQRWLAGPPTADGLGSALGGAFDGCLQDRMLLNEQGVARIPDYLSFDEASTLPCAALTAWRALVEEGNLRAGETVLVQGTGGVSVFALQFAKMFGAEVIITSSSDDKLDVARELGADHTVNYRTEPEWAKAVRRLTGGRGVDHVVEVGGAETLQQSIAAVALGGHIHLIGVLSGFVKDVNVAQLFATNARLHGITVGSRLMFENMVRAMALHQTHPVIDRAFGFADAREAFRLMESGGHFGKIVINH